ncbi:MAG: sarcosine oxidase subunit gamma family protein [Hyphomicrobium sp.]
MSDPSLIARSALATSLAASRAEVTIEAAGDLAIAHIAARKGQSAALIERLASSHGVAPPTTPKFTAGADLSFVWAGPEQWLAIAQHGNRRDLEAELAGQLKGFASVTDQSDARTFVRVSGPKSRATLAKGLPIDLHPRAFPAGAAAITHAAHIGVIVWRPDDSDTFMLGCARSYSVSLWSWLMESAAEYGASVY